MNPLVQNVNILLSSLTVVGHVILVVIAVLFALKKENLLLKASAYSLPFAFLIAFIATAGSLFYSEIANYTPCKFCWFQRIFMYPLVLLLGLALWKKEKNISLYAIPMTILGGIVAVNHYILQTTGTSILPCSAAGAGNACNKVLVMTFGYITIPMMAATAFALIFASLILYKKYQNRA